MVFSAPPFGPDFAWKFEDTPLPLLFEKINGVLISKTLSVFSNTVFGKSGNRDKGRRVGEIEFSPTLNREFWCIEENVEE